MSSVGIKIEGVTVQTEIEGRVGLGTWVYITIIKDLIQCLPDFLLAVFNIKSFLWDGIESSAAYVKDDAAFAIVA